MGPVSLLQSSSEWCQRLLGVVRNHFSESRVVTEQGQVFCLRHQCEMGLGVTNPDCPEQWRREHQIAQCAESDSKDAW